MTAQTQPQTRALVNALNRKLKPEGLRLRRRPDGEWTIMEGRRVFMRRVNLTDFGVFAGVLVRGSLDDYAKSWKAKAA